MNRNRKAHTFATNHSNGHQPELAPSIMLNGNGAWYSGLTAEQVERLKNDFGIYAVNTGRICVAALNDNNLDAVTQAIVEVL